MTGDMERDGITPGNMRKVIGDDLAWIAQHADAIALLPGWERAAASAPSALLPFLGPTCARSWSDAERLWKTLAR